MLISPVRSKGNKLKATPSSWIPTTFGFLLHLNAAENLRPELRMKAGILWIPAL